MSGLIDVVVSGSSIIKFPNFGGQNQGNVYVAQATPDRVNESSFVFGKDAVVIFQFSKVTDGSQTQNGYKSLPGEVSGNSRLVQITVYENAADYQAGIKAYSYQPQNPDGTNLSNSSDRYGDTYLAFQTNSFADQNKPPIRYDGYDGPIPKLGQELFIMPSVDLYQTLVVDKQSFTYSNEQNFDYDGNGKIDSGAERGNGFFNGIHSNDYVEDKIVCFARGTLILTSRGEVAVEELSVGDQVLTLDEGYQKVLWIGSKKLDQAALERSPKLYPVRITAGALGDNLPESDLLLSAQHRVLLRSKIAERVMGEREVLVAATHLIDDKSIYQDQSCTEVEYFHILLEKHQIVFSNGAPTESLFTGPMAMRSLSDEALEEIRALLPEVFDAYFQPQAARMLTSGKEGKKLEMRHEKNAQPLFAK